MQCGGRHQCGSESALLAPTSPVLCILTVLLCTRNYQQAEAALICCAETMEQYGVTGHEAVLVTPTGHVAWRGSPSALEDALSQVLGGGADAQGLSRAKTA